MSNLRAPATNWPPKSPHDALLLSPSGRKKLQNRRERTSVSPSPRRRPAHTSKASALLDLPDDDEEEDEETLQLKLQAIEARLKLKKLQKAKAERSEKPGTDSDGGRESARASTAAGSRRRRATPPVEAPAVEVPLSPTEDRRAPELPKSPARVLLGIDKGLRAQDVSLKRAASLRNRTSAPKNQFGSELSRPATSRGSSYVSQSSATASQPKSFSERIAESRLTDKQRQEKEERIQRSRSRGFGLDVNTAGGTQDEEDIWTASPAVSGGAGGRNGSAEGTADMGPPASKPPTSVLRTRRSMANINTTASTPSDSSKLSNRPTSSRSDSQQSISSKSTVPTLSTARHPSSSKPRPTAEDPPPTDTTSYDTFSNLHLTKRHIPHTTLTRTFDDKALYPIPKLLAEVKGPTYDPPDIESDYIVFGILASKSLPLAHRNGPQIASTADPDDEKQRSKYMVLRLTDLKWELDLFLFGSGFERWWKLTPGTVLAVLNPGIMPPRNRDTGAFSLKLGSEEDTVLEIGMARDLGFCKSVKKDGRECLSWIDKRKTEFCEFHVGLQVEKTKRGRMEVNTMVGWSGGKEKEGPRGRRLGGGMFGGRGKEGAGKDGLRMEGRFRDELTHETAYILPGQYSVGSAAKLLDADINGFERGRDPKELHRKRLAEQEKERELADRLAKSGSGMGSEYMRVRTETQAKSSVDVSGAAASSALHEPPDARALGLLGNKASDVSLSPVKRKRTLGSGTHSEPMGWGGAFKTGLLSPTKKVVGGLRSGGTERETSPAKKKARLLLDGKGIREPGRDSLGNVTVKDEDDDDDLDII
ncbi:hypothetical protein H2201_006195 [Coniosporium apollinis]|uniref:Zinc finger Mcm10/DnaG-type domain-containing protein n=1 Tax=Coniosporium apollinis TaxID=61459 RepID=A0ABQ9NRW8_9PEZI|nr:hypothetical protein H2201_006195 [Coniosporium apollinis]